MTNDIVDEVIKNGRKILVNKWITSDDFEEFVNNDNIRECIEKCTSPKDKKDIFNAFKIGKPEDVRVLILGQDPYPSGKGTGYAFLLKQQVTENDSLYYILKTINGGDFEPTIIDAKKVEKYKKWATDNKVLLLNTALTHESSDKNIVKKHSIAWEPFIKQIIKNLISNKKENLIVYLWGVPAQDLFFEILNGDEFNDTRNAILRNNRKNFSDTNRLRVDNKGFKKGNCIISKEKISVSLFTLYLYSHPSKLNDINGRPFDCHEHFKGKNINWQELLGIYKQ